MENATPGVILYDVCTPVLPPPILHPPVPYPIPQYEPLGMFLFRLDSILDWEMCCYYGPRTKRISSPRTQGGFREDLVGIA